MVHSTKGYGLRTVSTDELVLTEGWLVTDEAGSSHLHLDLASSQFAVQELPRRPGSYLTDLFPVQVPYAAGHLLAPTRPGLGIEMDESRVAHYPPLPAGRCPLWQRGDGAFTNW